MATIQERIKERRTTLKLTLLDIADKLGVKEPTVQRYESGEIKNIKHETILKIAEILECSPSYIMGWTDDIKAEINIDTKKELSQRNRIAQDIGDILIKMGVIEKDIPLDTREKEVLLDYLTTSIEAYKKLRKK